MNDRLRPFDRIEKNLLHATPSHKILAKVEKEIYFLFSNFMPDKPTVISSILNYYLSAIWPSFTFKTKFCGVVDLCLAGDYLFKKYFLLNG